MREYPRLPCAKHGDAPELTPAQELLWQFYAERIAPHAVRVDVMGQQARARLDMPSLHVLAELWPGDRRELLEDVLTIFEALQA